MYIHCRKITDKRSPPHSGDSAPFQGHFFETIIFPWKQTSHQRPFFLSDLFSLHFIGGLLVQVSLYRNRKLCVDTTVCFCSANCSQRRAAIIVRFSVKIFCIVGFCVFENHYLLFFSSLVAEWRESIWVRSCSESAVSVTCWLLSSNMTRRRGQRRSPHCAHSVNLVFVPFISINPVWTARPSTWQ